VQQHIGNVFQTTLPDPHPSVRAVFPSNAVYPLLNFSILNEGNTPIQITSIKVIKAAAVLDNHTGVEHLIGTRHKLDWSLQAAQTGIWSEVFGEDLVAALNPGESEAFQLRLECQNAVCIVDIAIEYVTAGELGQGVLVPDQIIAVHAPVESVHGDRGNGCITCISRELAFENLLNEGQLELWRSRVYGDCTAHHVAFARAAGFLCLGSLEQRWDLLCAKYDGSSIFGVMVTSLAELGATIPLPMGLSEFARNWVARRGNLGLVPIWDAEVLPSVLLHAIERQVNSPEPRVPAGERHLDEVSQYLRILDNSLEMWTPSSDDADNDFFSQIMRMTAVMQGQRTALNAVIGKVGLAATEILVALCCVETIAVHSFHELLIDTLRERAGHFDGIVRTLIDAEKFSLSDDEKFAEFWLRGWYQIRGTDAFGLWKWQPSCPRLAAAFTAYSTDSDAMQMELAAHPDPYVRQAAARNRRATHAALARLAHDSEVGVRFFVATNAATESDTLQRLANDSESIVRRWVAVHPNTDDHTLRELAGDHSPKVRAMLERRD
jgi:hypothetical protein